MAEGPSHNHLTGTSTEDRIRALVEVLSAYIEQYHGGWVRMAAFDGRVLKVEMGGACQGCPLSAGTLHGWVEGTIRQFFPQVERVEEI
jgi:Fe-S cluster biogenesis protein NfuA